MLLRLLPEEISKYWPIIKSSLTQTLTKEEIDTEAKKNNILKSLLLGNLVCWFYKKDTKVIGVILTSIIRDDFINQKKLLIYSVSEKGANAEDWMISFDTLNKYAKGSNCYKIVFNTKNEKFIRIAKHMGKLDVYHTCEILL